MGRWSKERHAEEAAKKAAVAVVEPAPEPEPLPEPEEVPEPDPVAVVEPEPAKEFPAGCIHMIAPEGAVSISIGDFSAKVEDGKAWVPAVHVPRAKRSGFREM